jgi:hypothetical protein
MTIIKTEILDKVDCLLDNIAPSGPTFFQLTYFVVGQEPTAQARMRRCLEEMKSRRNMTKAASLEIEEANDVNNLHRLDIRRAASRYEDEQERAIRIKQLKRKIISNDRHIKDLEDKIKGWIIEINFLRECYEKISSEESLKPWNDYGVQLEYWNAKLTKDIKSKLLLKNSVDIMTLETALALPDNAPIKQQLEEMLEKKEKNVQQISGSNINT